MEKPVIVFADNKEIADITRVLKLREGFYLAASAGWEVNFEDALQRIATYQPAVIFIDHNAGEVPGGSSELARRIRHQYPELIIVMITLTSESDWMLKCLQAGVNDILSRPLGTLSILHALDYLVLRKKIISVLVMTDIGELAKDIEKFLSIEQEIGFTCMAVIGESDLQWVLQHPYDVVILDISFTNMIRMFRQAMPDAVMIMMSVANDLSWERICLLAGADDFLTKPLDQREVLHTIRVNLAHRKNAPI